MEKTTVLFLCTGNSARSQMAEAWLKKIAGDRLAVYSAGYEPQGINPFTRKVMEEVGIDLSGQSSKGVEEFLGKMKLDYLITVCDRAEKNCPTAFPGIRQRLFWPFADPAAVQGDDSAKLAQFRDIRDQIEARIRLWLREMA